ncbi:MAG: GTP cyclohydrolase I FolE [Agathobacter sp.]|nr:GTP cyclohydrolase I FolE [Agathobacter sp.]
MFDKRQEAVKEILANIDGEDVTREGLLETPKRVAKMHEELFEGYKMDPKEILGKRFDVDITYDEDAPVMTNIYNNGLVIVKDIQFFSQCEHHMVPFYGKVHIAYIPKDEVVGLSKLARLTECYARRLQVQERMTNQIKTAIEENLNPLGVMVVIEAEHMCMVMRGIKKIGTKTITSSMSGVFTENDALRAETMSLLRG